MIKTYAQIDTQGVVIGYTQTEGEINASHMIEVDDGDVVIGKQWDGEKFNVPAPDQRRVITDKLAEIDRKAGMSRLLRETLIAIGEDKVPAIIKTHENNAAALRAELVALQ